MVHGIDSGGESSRGDWRVCGRAPRARRGPTDVGPRRRLPNASDRSTEARTIVEGGWGWGGGGGAGDPFPAQAEWGRRPAGWELL